MSQIGETFFTSVGCMDGRVQGPVAEFGREKFGAKFPDTITEPGLVGVLAKKPVSEDLLNSIKRKIDVSINKHHSKGIIVHGHEDCAASDAVNDLQHKENIITAANVIKTLINDSLPIIPVFIKREDEGWVVEELSL